MFLHIENLEILWNALQKTPYLVEFTQKTILGEKERWFRGICEQFYRQWTEQNGTIPTNSRELLEINKVALQYAITELKRTLGYSQTAIANHTRGDEFASYNVTAERKQREEARSSEFNQYKSEYERLLERPVVPANHLPSLTSDEKITNMEELVQQHLKMRNMDLTLNSNEPLVKATPIKASLTPKLKIMDSIENVDMEISALSSFSNKTAFGTDGESFNSLENRQMPKSVHWSIEMRERRSEERT